MGSHSVTCHPTQVNVPHRNPSQAGLIRFTCPGRMEGWLHLGSLTAAQPGIEHMTTWSQVLRTNRYATESPNTQYFYCHICDFWELYEQDVWQAKLPFRSPSQQHQSTQAPCLHNHMKRKSWITLYWENNNFCVVLTDNADFLPRWLNDYLMPKMQHYCPSLFIYLSPHKTTQNVTDKCLGQEMILRWSGTSYTKNIKLALRHNISLLVVVHLFFTGLH